MHLHDLYHVQVGFRRSLVDGKDGIDDGWVKLLSKASVEFCGQGCSGNGKEEFSVDLF